MTKWRKMNSAPKDGSLILVGKWVNHAPAPDQHWVQYVGFYDVESDCILDVNFEELSYLDAWTPIPKPPHWGKE